MHNRDELNLEAGQAALEKNNNMRAIATKGQQRSLPELTYQSLVRGNVRHEPSLYSSGVGSSTANPPAKSTANGPLWKIVAAIWHAYSLEPSIDINIIMPI